MAFSITYDASLVDGSTSVADYLASWASLFGDSNHTSGNVGSNNTGGFWGETTAQYGGSQYSLTSTANGVTAFIAEGDLEYTFSSHTLNGTVDSLNFGDDLAYSAADGYSLQSLEVTFNGLADIVTDVHSVVYGLMRGSVDALVSALETAGIDTTDSLASYATASTTAVAAVDNVVDVVGVTDSVDTLLAA